MLFDKSDAQLLFISCQKSVLNSSIEADVTAAQWVKLAEIARIFQLPIWSILNLPHLWGEQMETLRPYCPKPIESPAFNALNVLAPMLNPAHKPSGGNSKSLPKHLQKPLAPVEPKRPVIVMAGCMVHVGVLQTALELLDSGYEPLVVVDACTAMNQKDKDTAFDRLASAGVDLTTVEMLGMEWLLSSNAPETASVLAQLYPV